MPIVRNVADLRVLMHRNERPIYFASATNFNLLGIDDWVRNFRFVCYIDSFDGRHPNVFVPSKLPHAEFQSIEEINNYLLQHKEVIDYIGKRGGKPAATFLMFDNTTEDICRDLDIEIWFPPANLRQRCDNKMETVRIGNKAHVASVPNVLSSAGSYELLNAAARAAGLGDDLVVQTAFGDSGHTTFFIASEADYRRHEAELEHEREVKIMKRIECRGGTMEACATRSGTLVGPLLTEIVGKKELTPYKGGWCGNEIFAGVFSESVRRKAREMAFAFGNQLVSEGYKGYFDLDFLIDESSGEVYLGELNPRLCGASSITNHAAFAYADAPLWLFHLLEFSGAEFDIDVEALNGRWADEDFIDSWSQLVIKSTSETVDIVTHAPPSGIYRMEHNGDIAFDRFDYRRQAINSEQEAFFLRITGRGDYRYKGADLGILITRGRSMTGNFELNDRAIHWIEGIRRLYHARSLAEEEFALPPDFGAFKIL